jgi:hypothetical protein
MDQPTIPLGRNMAQYKAFFLHMSQDRFILNAFLHGYTSFSCTSHGDKAAQNFLTSIRDLEKQVCTQTFGRKNMAISS